MISVSGPNGHVIVVGLYIPAKTYGEMIPLVHVA